MWHPRGKELGYLYLGESLDDSNVPRSPSSGREDIRYCGNKLSGTKLQIVAAGNWLEHSKVLRSMNVNRAQAVVWFFPLLFLFPAMSFSSNLIRGIRAERLTCLFLSCYFFPLRKFFHAYLVISHYIFPQITWIRKYKNLLRKAIVCKTSCCKCCELS